MFVGGRAASQGQTPARQSWRVRKRLRQEVAKGSLPQRLRVPRCGEFASRSLLSREVLLRQPVSLVDWIGSCGLAPTIMEAADFGDLKPSFACRGYLQPVLDTCQEGFGRPLSFSGSPLSTSVMGPLGTEVLSFASHCCCPLLPSCPFRSSLSSPANGFVLCGLPEQIAAIVSGGVKVRQARHWDTATIPGCTLEVISKAPYCK